MVNFIAVIDFKTESYDNHNDLGVGIPKIVTGKAATNMTCGT